MPRPDDICLNLEKPSNINNVNDVYKKLKISGLSSGLSLKVCKKINPTGRRKILPLGTNFNINPTASKIMAILKTNKDCRPKTCWPKYASTSNNQWLLIKGKLG